MVRSVRVLLVLLQRFVCFLKICAQVKETILSMCSVSLSRAVEIARPLVGVRDQSHTSIALPQLMHSSATQYFNQQKNKRFVL